MKILLIVGTRPEAIKLVPVYRALSECDWCDPRIIITGQHREMARGVLNLFGVMPHLDLDVMESRQTLISLSARLTNALSEVIGSEQPDAILVQGDTTSAMIGSYLGFYSGCRVGHVEAGLRTGNLHAPYPEEFNRRVIALGAYWHFAPTAAAAENLSAERLVENVHVVGNTVIDAALDMAQRSTPRMRRLSDRLPFLTDPARRTVLVTTHRRESFGSAMQGIAAAIAELASDHPGADFVVPVHPNPEVGAALRPTLEGIGNVHLTAPLEYDEVILVLRNAFLALTDSGGIQEEAPAFRVPVLVMRNETERLEGIRAGCSQLVGTDRGRIVEAATRLFHSEALHARMAESGNPYGNGRSGRTIAGIIGRSR